MACCFAQFDPQETSDLEALAAAASRTEGLSDLRDLMDRLPPGLPRLAGAPCESAEGAMQVVIDDESAEGVLITLKPGQGSLLSAIVRSRSALRILQGIATIECVNHSVSGPSQREESDDYLPGAVLAWQGLEIERIRNNAAASATVVAFLLSVGTIQQRPDRQTMEGGR